ncbi:MFS transporter [Streptomyces sp. NPDC001020]
MPGTLTGGRRLLLVVVCAVAVANVYAVQPVLADIGSGLGVRPSALGWLVAVAQGGYLFGLIVLVPLGDVLNRRRLIAGHLALTAVGTGIVSVSHIWAVGLAGLGVAGLFAVVVQTTVAYTAAISPPHERGRNIGVVTSGVTVGILGARAAAGALTDLWGWRSVYVTLAAVSNVLALLVLVALPPDARREGVPARYGQLIRSMVRLALRDRLLLSRSVIAFFLFASFGTLWSGITLPLEAAPWHLSPAQVGLFGFAGLAGALGAGRAGRWADRGRASSVTGWSLLALAASWLLIGQTGRSLWLLGAGVLLLDFAVQAVHVSNQHLLTGAHPDRTSSAIGAYMAFYSLGSALGAVTTTWAYTNAGWRAVSLLGASYAAVAFTAWVLSVRLAPARPTRLPEGSDDAPPRFCGRA